jgi:hypothetical protein
MILHDRVTRLRGTPTSGGVYGGQDTDWSNPGTAVYPAEVQPISQTEDVAGQQRTQTRWRVFLPPSADVLATDRIVWDGVTYEVEGEVERWKRRGVLHHLEAVLVKVTQG